MAFCRLFRFVCTFWSVRIYFISIFYSLILLSFLYFFCIISVSFFPSFLLSSIYIRRKYWIRKNFRLQFSMDLHVLRCPEHDLTIFRRCLSVCLQKFCGHCISRTNWWKLMKLYI